MNSRHEQEKCLLVIAIPVGDGLRLVAMVWRFSCRLRRRAACLAAIFVWATTQILLVSHVAETSPPWRPRKTRADLSWGQYGLWALWSTLTSLGPRNIITVLQGMLPQLANTTFYFSATDFPAVEGLVALTIDDGICRGGNWSASLLPEVLELLAGSSAKATFFLSSHYVRPKDLRRLVSQGHELANHMPEDREYASWPVEEFREALDETDAVLRPFMRADARHWFRAPQARLTSDMAVVLQARNMSHALGDCYADDWAIPDALRVASVLLRQVQSGSVAVLHMPQRGFRQHTLEVLRHFLQGLAKRQLRAVTLSQLADAALAGRQPEDKKGFMPALLLSCCWPRFVADF
eukprot:s7104_g1.t1